MLFIVATVSFIVGLFVGFMMMAVLAVAGDADD